MTTYTRELNTGPTWWESVIHHLKLAAANTILALVLAAPAGLIVKIIVKVFMWGFNLL